MVAANKINVYIPKNNNLFIGIILVFIVFALIIYMKPQLFIFLFNTILGNCLLGLGIVLLGLFDVKWAVGLAALLVILYQTVHLSGGNRGSGSVTDNKKEGMTSLSSSSILSDPSDPSDPSSSSERNAVYTVTTWPQQTITNFINFQKVHNPNLTFDINILQQQATAAEVQSLFENNIWPWSDDIKQMYQDAMANNWNVSVSLGSSLNTAQSIYNQTAIMELLAWNTKEGEFLIDGAVIGQSANMPSNVNNIVRCSSSSSSSSSSSGSSNILEQVIYTGYNSISGNLQSQVTPVSNSDIPSIVNGFQFLGTGSCNPCSALDYPPNYSCPFSINTGNGASVSPIWQKLWGLGGSSSSGSSSSLGADIVPSNISSGGTSLSEKQFPLLTQLTNELSDAAAPLLESVLASMKNKRGGGSSGASGASSSSGVVDLTSIKSVGVATNPPSSIDKASSAVTNGSSSGNNYRPTNME